MSFILEVISVSGSGFSRTVVAHITNKASVDSHDVWGRVEVFSRGDRIQVCQQDHLRVNVGTIKARATVTVKATLDFSLFGGLKIQNYGAKVLITANSSEGSQTLTYDYQP